jgi:hypothetical protein
MAISVAATEAVAPASLRKVRLPTGKELESDMSGKSPYRYRCGLVDILKAGFY